MSRYDQNDEGSNNYYQDFDFSDGEGSTGSGCLNGGDDDLYVDQSERAARTADRPKKRERKKAAKAAPSHGGGLEALMAQAPTRNNSIGILGDRVPVPRTRPAPPLRTRSGGVLKLNRKISRAVTDSTRHLVGAATTVAEVATSVARGREEERDGERVRSNSLGALTRKLTSRAERKAAKEAVSGMNNLSLDDNNAAPKEGRMRESSIGALSRRARRQRVKSVDDAADLDFDDGATGEMELNQQSPLNSPVRQRNSAGAITTNKARRERWKSVDDAEDLMDDEGEFEMKLEDSPRTTPKKKERKRANSIGAVNTKARRERRKSIDSTDHSMDDDGEKKTKKKSKKKSAASDDELSDDDRGKKTKTKRKIKRSASKGDISDDSSDDGTVNTRRKGKKKTSKKKPSKKVSSDDQPPAELGLGGGQARGRRVGRRSSLGSSEAMKMQSEANEILRRTQQVNQRWDPSKEEDSAIERRVRRRASIGL